MRRILLVLAATAVMLALAASSVAAKPTGLFCALAPIAGTGDSLVVCGTAGMKSCKERVAERPDLNFGKCTKGLPEA